MSTAAHSTGTARSGDVDIFYRHFGAPGATPILITHGANYYDSADWIDVAAALAADREVAAFDTRGFGRSSWSPSKDYSLDAQMADMTAVLDRLGWRTAVVMGHSAGGGRAIVFGARFPQRVAGVIIVDHCPAGGNAKKRAPRQSVGNQPLVFATIADAVGSMSRHAPVAAGSPAEARLKSILAPTQGGFAYPRDPDYANPIPVMAEAWSPVIVVDDMWAELAAIASPTMIFRGTLSDRYDAASAARVRDEFPDIDLVDIETGHDVAGAAPDALIDGIRRFLARRIDGAAAAAQ